MHSAWSVFEAESQLPEVAITMYTGGALMAIT